MGFDVVLIAVYGQERGRILDAMKATTRRARRDGPLQRRGHRTNEVPTIWPYRRGYDNVVVAARRKKASRTVRGRQFKQVAEMTISLMERHP
jgi:hypothetical protein